MTKNASDMTPEEYERFSKTLLKIIDRRLPADMRAVLVLIDKEGEASVFTKYRREQLIQLFRGILDGLEEVNAAPNN